MSPLQLAKKVRFSPQTERTEVRFQDLVTPSEGQPSELNQTSSEDDSLISSSKDIANEDHEEANEEVFTNPNLQTAKQKLADIHERIENVLNSRYLDFIVMKSNRLYRKVV